MLTGFKTLPASSLFLANTHTSPITLAPLCEIQPHPTSDAIWVRRALRQHFPPACVSSQLPSSYCLAAEETSTGCLHLPPRSGASVVHQESGRLCFSLPSVTLILLGFFPPYTALTSGYPTTTVARIPVSGGFHNFRRAVACRILRRIKTGTSQQPRYPPPCCFAWPSSAINSGDCQE